MPSYNQGRFIEATIRLVFLLEYPNLECIVMDGGSEDETVGILQRYDADIDFWQSESGREQMGHRCREVVEAKYTLAVQARAYEQLYRSLLA